MGRSLRRRGFAAKKVAYAAPLCRIAVEREGAGRGREGIFAPTPFPPLPLDFPAVSVLPFASKSGISRPPAVALPDRAVSDGGLRICVADLFAAGHLFAGIAKRAGRAVWTAAVRSAEGRCSVL